MNFFSVLIILIALNSRAAPVPHSASLLSATGRISINIHPTQLRGPTAWIPLPLDYATQVPLYFRVSVKPSRLALSIIYQADELGNWGASITLNPNRLAAKSAVFMWDTLVFTERVANDSKRALLYQHSGDNTEWLKSTEIVQSDDENIKNVTAQAITGKSSALEKMKGIIDWTASHIKYKFHPELDAASALKYRESTCTGYANLAAAMGRAAGIPSATLAGYLVGMPQETHWINEYFLGESLGWQRVEPEKKKGYVSEDYFISIRIDRSTDEVKWEYTLGTPLNSYPVVPIGIPIPVVNAVLLQKLYADSDETHKLFLKLRSQWKFDFNDLLKKGSLRNSRRKLRSKFSEVASFKDIETIVSHLEVAK